MNTEWLAGSTPLYSIFSESLKSSENRMVEGFSLCFEIAQNVSFLYKMNLFFIKS